jgi:hypothetical protein
VFSFSDKDLLLLWENAEAGVPVEKALLMLAFFYPDMEAGALAQISIGSRDARLLQARAALFGSTLRNTALCPHCGQKTEWEMPLDALRLQTPDDTPAAIELSHQNRLYRFSLPNSTDLLHILRIKETQLQEAALVQRCLVQAEPPVEAPDISPELIEAFSAAVGRHDPQADINFRLQCPGCSREWEAMFDIVQYLWLEIQEAALRVLQEVYALARSFGWSENDILSMSRRRRHLYLNMIQA